MNYCNLPRFMDQRVIKDQIKNTGEISLSQQKLESIDICPDANHGAGTVVYLPTKTG